MLVNLCPQCRRIHASDAQRCSACGAELGEGDSWWPSQPLPAEGEGSLWLDVSAPARAVPVPPEAGPLHLDLTLREVGVPPAQPAAVRGPVAAQGRAAAETGRAARPQAAPVAEPAGWRASTPTPASTPSPKTPDALTLERAAALARAAPQPARRPPPATPGVAAAATASPATRSTQKVARRGEVRRARLRSATPAHPAANEVLVLDPDAGSRGLLRELLQGFGFVVTETAAVAHAAALAAAQPFVAAFLDIRLDAADGGGGIDLCRRLRQDAAQRGAGTLLVLMAADLSPVDRVRADLAGFDDTLVKPASRGAVAGVLDGHGVALPADARRA